MNNLTQDNESIYNLITHILDFKNPNNRWIFFRSNEDREDIYLRNEVYGTITQPSKRDDGFIATLVAFSKDINKF